MTCTPYGVNTHRLLVRGRCVNTEEIAEFEEVLKPGTRTETTTVPPAVMIPLIAAPFALVVIIGLLIATRKRSRGKNAADSERKDSN
jgi:sortase A